MWIGLLRLGRLKLLQNHARIIQNALRILQNHARLVLRR